MPEEIKEAEMDEQFTFIGDKKSESTLKCTPFSVPPIIRL